MDNFDNSITITNLPECTKKNDVLNLIKKYGKIKNILLHNDDFYCNEPKYAIVNFENNNDRLNIFNNINGMIFYDYKLDVHLD